ncbi:hypothetical protein, partial [Mycobacterium tuberculosis]|uniref:hypothetical protein n=1 Tax=Mycobacterium tuberculosis TaxID=1773 RepID=UPI001AE403AD
MDAQDFREGRVTPSFIDERLASYRRTKCIIKHYEQASFLNMEVGVFHSHAYPFVHVTGGMGL